MAKYIKKKDLKNAIYECTWYHIGKNGELVEGANSSEHEPLYKYSDIKEIIKNLPTRKFETEPKHTALSKALKWTYGDEPNKKIKADRKTENSSENPNNCDDCIWSVCNYNKAFEDEPTISKMEQVDEDINVRSKDEPQTDGYMTAEQTDDYRKMLDKAEHKVYGNIEDEPQTELKGSKRLVKGSGEETEIERLDRIDSEIEDAWARIRELTPLDEPLTERGE